MGQECRTEKEKRPQRIRACVSPYPPVLRRGACALGQREHNAGRADVGGPAHHAVKKDLVVRDAAAARQRQRRLPAEGD